VLSGLSLIGMLIWELSPRNRHPVVELRVLKNRDLAACLFLFVALGFALYGGTFMFPLFTQTILNFTPTKTGLSLMPGGLATAATALLCGRLLTGSKPLADARVLIGAGVVMIIWAMWRLGHLSVFAGDDDVRIALIIRGAALGLLFAPINNVAFASLKPSEAQQAAGLINLSRQLGGSFGIAVLATYVTTHTQIHRVDLLANLDAGNPLVQERLHGITAGLVAQGMSAVTAQSAALKVLDGQLTRQAAMLSYNDAWLLLLTTFLVVSPAILLLRKPRVRFDNPAAEAH
ncbi:MAG: MFS transporter, partial [Candidatus Eiseniibacteriota bacterium]